MSKICNNRDQGYVKTTMIDTLLGFLAPHICCGCGKKGNLLCESCKYDIIHESYNSCVGCLKPMAKRNICPTCRRKTGVDEVWCVGSREGALLALIDQYKFEGKRAAAPLLSKMLSQVVPLLPTDVVVMSVPTAARHIRERGYDHMGIVTKRLARQKGLRRKAPLRKYGSSTLHFMDEKSRWKVAKESFVVARTDCPKSVLIVDDIVTTGATLTAVSKLLRAHGTTRVYAAILARQPFERY